MLLVGWDCHRRAKRRLFVVVFVSPTPMEAHSHRATLETRSPSSTSASVPRRVCRPRVWRFRLSVHPTWQVSTRAQIRGNAGSSKPCWNPRCQQRPNGAFLRARANEPARFLCGVSPFLAEPRHPSDGSAGSGSNASVAGVGCSIRLHRRPAAWHCRDRNSHRQARRQMEGQPESNWGGAAGRRRGLARDGNRGSARNG